MYVVLYINKLILTVWDIRKFKEPLCVRDQIENNYPETNITFSPNGEYILTGSSIATKDTGKLVILKTYNLEIVNELCIHDSAVIRTLWHTKINQVKHLLLSNNN